MKLVANMIVGGIITRVAKSYAMVELGEHRGIVHVSNVADFFLDDLNDLFKPGEHYLWQVLKVDPEVKVVRLSWKTLMPRFQKDPFQFELVSTPKGFSSLRKLVEEDAWLN